MQSLILGAVLFNAAVVLAALGVHRRPAARPADHARSATFERVRRIELQLGVAAVALRAGRDADRPAADDRRARRRRRHDRGARGGAAVSATITRDAEGTVTGNTYDKYGSDEPGRASG